MAKIGNILQITQKIAAFFPFSRHHP